MNETKLVIFGLITLVAAAILLWVLDEPEILLDKEIELTIALGVGLLILILDRRADRRIHEIIHEQHLLIDKMHKKIDEQSELIKNIQQKISLSSSSSSHEGHVSSNKRSS
jgi:plasmid maintenance system antidote protein VapI